jgi:hypothetical protein
MASCHSVVSAPALVVELISFIMVPIFRGLALTRPGQYYPEQAENIVKLCRALPRWSDVLLMELSRKLEVDNGKSAKFANGFLHGLLHRDVPGRTYISNLRELFCFSSMLSPTAFRLAFGLCSLSLSEVSLRVHHAKIFEHSNVSHIGLRNCMVFCEVRLPPRLARLELFCCCIGPIPATFAERVPATVTDFSLCSEDPDQDVHFLNHLPPKLRRLHAMDLPIDVLLPSTLRELQVGGTEISTQELRTLASRLPPKLVKFKLDMDYACGQTSEDGVDEMAVCDLLRCAPDTMAALSIVSCGLAVSSLFDQFHLPSRLRVLNFGDNALCKYCMRVLARNLPNTIRSLNLRGNALCEEAVSLFCCHMPPELRDLDLSYNPISMLGVICLAGHLPATLVELMLDGIEINKSAALLLVSRLGPKARVLSFSHKMLSDEQRKVVLTAAKPLLNIV